MLSLISTMETMKIQYSAFRSQHYIFAMVGQDAGCAHADRLG